jgi:hypothetical protein
MSNEQPVRTTLALDPAVLAAARRIAAERSQTLGQTISELARRGLRASANASARKGFPIFSVASDAPPLTPGDVRRAADAE